LNQKDECEERRANIEESRRPSRTPLPPLPLPPPWLWWAGLTKAGICPADACLPTGPENPLFSFVPLIGRHVKKRRKLTKKIPGGIWVNKCTLLSA